MGFIKRPPARNVNLWPLGWSLLTHKTAAIDFYVGISDEASFSKLFDIN